MMETFDFTTNLNLSPNTMNAIINLKFNTIFVQYLMQHSVTISSLQQKRKRKSLTRSKTRRMLHESDTDDWCLAKRLRPYEYLSQCQCSMRNTFL